MSGTAPTQDQGPCDGLQGKCCRPYGHRGKCLPRMCARDDCTNTARNADERYCTRHEDWDTYVRYWAESHPGESPGFRW